MVKDGNSVEKVLFRVLLLNWAVSAAKMTYGYYTGSIGMVSDGFHSLFDGMSNVFGLIGIRLASRPPDREHPYGHRKYETFFTVMIAVMIFAACLQILKKVYDSFFSDGIVVVNAGSFAIMLFTMAVNIAVMRYEMKRGGDLRSDFLIADSLHTKSDVFVSFSVVLGLVLTKAGFRHADAIVGLGVTVLIAKIGYKIAKRASDILVDTILINPDFVCRVVEGIDGVKGCHDVRSRGTAEHICIDMHITVEAHLSVSEAHGISERVEDRLKEAFPNVADVVIHIEPEENK